MRFRSLALTERNRLLNCLTFPAAATLAKLAPLLLLDSIGALLFGKNRLAKLNAWAWIALHGSAVCALRKKRQTERTLADREALAELSWNYFSTAAAGTGITASAKRLANALVALYMRALFIPGRRHG